jgi:hypothetical protein
MTRICKKCKTEKPLSDYAKDRKCYGGHRPTCKECADIPYREAYKQKYPQANRQHCATQKALNEESQKLAKHRQQPWDKQSDEFLREFFQTEGVIDIANALGRTMMAIRKRASVLGLKRERQLPYRTER